MRRIDLIVMHCTATRCDRPYTVEQMTRDHQAQGFGGAGYHFYILRNGRIVSTRPIECPGCHVAGHNAYSIGIAYEGGLDEHGHPADTRTHWQRTSMRALLRCLLADFPHAVVCGHRDLSPDLNGNGIIEPHEWVKQCPCFEVSKEELINYTGAIGCTSAD